MSSPNANEVKIRLEISVPTGVNVNLGGGATLPPVIKILFAEVGNPDTQTPYQANPNVCVQPVNGSSLGSVRLYFTFPDRPYAVSAIVYPIAFDHDTPEPPNGAQPGTPSQNNSVWTWTNLKSVDHTSTLSAARNVTRLWTKATAQSPWVRDDNTFPFFGYSGSGSPCGSGSSGSTSLATPWPGLVVQVCDGPRAGQYRATPVGALVWEVKIAQVTYQLHLTQTGAAAFLSGTDQTVRAKVAGQNPVYAVFPGAIFGSAGGVVVTQA